jgi:hypothetical protein
MVFGKTRRDYEYHGAKVSSPLSNSCLKIPSLVLLQNVVCTAQCDGSSSLINA